MVSMVSKLQDITVYSKYIYYRKSAPGKFEIDIRDTSTGIPLVVLQVFLS